jgi:hypothetical protein
VRQNARQLNGGGLSPQLSNRDPVHNLKLSSVIGGKIVEAQALNGGPDLFAARWLTNVVDPLVLEELQKRVSGTLKG